MKEIECANCGKSMIATSSLKRCSYCGKLFRESLSKSDMIIIVPEEYNISYKTKEVYIDDEPYMLYHNEVRNIYYTYEDIDTDICTVIRSNEIMNSSSIKKHNTIEAEDFLIRCHNYNCINRNHQLQQLNAIVRTIDNRGMFEVMIPAAYCPNCDQYYILERHYNELKRFGYICCRIDTFESVVSSSGGYDSRQEKSIPMQYGYTVSKKKGLTDSERRKILDFIIDNGVLSKSEVIEHIEWLISEREDRPNMETAIYKWNKDLNYVRNKYDVNRSVLVGSMRVPLRRVRIR